MSMSTPHATVSFRSRDSIELPLMDSQLLAPTGNASFRSPETSTAARSPATSLLARSRLDTAGTMQQTDSMGVPSSFTLRGSRVPTLTAEELERQQGTSSEKGLSSEQAKLLFKECGPNELESIPPTPFCVIWLNQFKDVLMLIILAAAMINLFGLKSYMTGVVMSMIFFGATLVNAVGEWVIAEGGSALANLSAATATVWRDGEEKEVLTRELVPGDVVHVKLGDTIPADMRITVATDLRVDESVLTGESQEVTKTDQPLCETNLEPFPVNMLFSSTACVSGKGSGIVIATGMRSQVGQIAARLDTGVHGLSPLQETMNKVGKSIGFMVCFLTILITALLYMQRYQDASRPCRQNDDDCFALTAFAQGLVLGVSLVPGTMPVMITVLLSVARKTIERKHTVVRKTSTVETLGACMAICSDKTGTLTEGKMTAMKAVTMRSGGLQRFSFYPTAGQDPNGDIYKDEDLKCLRPDTARYGRGLQGDVDDAHVRTLLMAASLNSYSTRLAYSDGKWMTQGNLSEGALVVAAAKAGIGPHCENLKLECATDLHPPELEVEVPFSSARKMASTVHQVQQGMFAGLQCAADVTHVGIVKGAPDRLMPLVECSLAAGDQGKLVLESGCPEEALRQITAENANMADESLRVLLLCVRLLTAKDMAQLRSLEVDARVELLTKKMAIVGAFGILDPPRATVGPAIEKCKSAGIRVVMITGDQQATATAIAMKLDIIQYRSQARLCADIYDVDGNMVPDEELDLMVEKTRVWARAQPCDKVAIVQSLQRMGFVTAMTGDGVNDAPALKLADIGTAMGITGTEVAKGSADIVLLNDDFTTIVEAVQEGRRTYTNIQIYVTFYLSLSIPEVLGYSICILAGFPIPVTTLQVLVSTILTNMVPPILYYRHPIDDHAMKVSPRKKDSDLISRGTILWVVCPWSLCWGIGWVLLSNLGLWMHTGFTRGGMIVGTSEYHAIQHKRATCEFALSENEEGELVRDAEPFHCLCPVRTHLLGQATDMEQWGLTLEDLIAADVTTSNAGKRCEASDQKCVSEKRSEIGLANLEVSFGYYKTPLYTSTNSAVSSKLRKCHEDGGDHWCWNNPKLAPADRPALDIRTNCGTLGSDVAHTMAFIGNSFAKLVLTFAMGSPNSLLFSLNKNRSVAISVSICLFLVFVYAYSYSFFGFLMPSTMPLAFGTLITTLMFPLAAHLALDVSKSFFRFEILRIINLKIFHAQAIGKGLLSPQADDAEIEAYRQENPSLSCRTFHH